MPSDEWRAELKRQLDEAADAIMFLDEEGTVERDWSVDDVVNVAVDVALAFAEEKVREERDKWLQARQAIDRHGKPPGESRCGTCGGERIVRRIVNRRVCPDAFHRQPMTCDVCGWPSVSPSTPPCPIHRPPTEGGGE